MSDQQRSEKGVKRWLFEQRDASSKYVSDLEINVRDKSTSPVESAVVFLLLFLWGYGPFALLTWMYFSATMGMIGMVVFAGTALVIVPWTLFAFLVTLARLPGALSKYFGPKRVCETCGARHRYTHSLLHKHGFGPSNEDRHDFCSRDCRATFERENLEGTEPELQTERDYDHWNAKAEREFLEGYDG